MHQSALGYPACESGLEDGGARRLFRRGVTSPLRLKMSANVLIEGSSMPGCAFLSTARSFFGPQFGRSFRAATMASSSAAATALGLLCGRRERSSSSQPARNRSSHLYAVFRLTSKRRHSADTLCSCFRYSSMNALRCCTGDTSFQGKDTSLPATVTHVLRQDRHLVTDLFGPICYLCL